MFRFIQLHILTSYPAANLNRDDLGAPKSMRFGEANRLRVSSQSLKRAWRTSEVFQNSLGERHLGVRTKEIGKYVYYALTRGEDFIECLRNTSLRQAIKNKLPESKAIAISRDIGGAFGALKSKQKKSETSKDKILESLETEQLVHINLEEIIKISKLVEECRETGKTPTGDKLAVLKKNATAVDIAMFGRMLTDNKSGSSKDNDEEDDKEDKKKAKFKRAHLGTEAAVQVAHAVTVHRAVAEDDFFTAVDDLNRDDAGAGHMGISEFGAGVYYLYLCIDRALLAENLGGDEGLVQKALTALTTAACTVAPTGKQASYASRAYACFALAEKGDDTPRNLSLAFLKPVGETDAERDGHLGETAINRLKETKEKMDAVYGQDLPPKWFNVFAGEGSLAELAAFVAG